MPDINDASGDIPVKTAKVNGSVREIRFEINPHGFVFIKLSTAGEKEGI